MSRTILFLLISVFLFTGCKKETSAPPVASFTFSHKADDLRMATSDTTMLIGSVSAASSVSWDLGDGRRSDASQLILSYAKSGTYTVSLTARAQDGRSSTVTRQVIVLDRVLKNIIIDKVYWNTTDPYFAQAGWPTTSTADLYVKIQILQGNDTYQGGFAPAAPVVYSSPLIANVSKVNTSAINISVSPRVVLEKPLVEARTYLISLIAKNASGEYVLFSNWYSGSGQNIRVDSFSKNTFTVATSFFSSMILNCDFE